MMDDICHSGDDTEGWQFEDGEVSGRREMVECRRMGGFTRRCGRCAWVLLQVSCYTYLSVLGQGFGIPLTTLFVQFFVPILMFLVAHDNYSEYVGCESEENDDLNCEKMNALCANRPDGGCE